MKTKDLTNILVKKAKIIRKETSNHFVNNKRTPAQFADSLKYIYIKKIKNKKNNSLEARAMTEDQ